MSSYEKDARWYLANLMCEAAGLDIIRDVPYLAREVVLDAAQELIDYMPEAKIAELAKKTS